MIPLMPELLVTAFRIKVWRLRCLGRSVLIRMDRLQHLAEEEARRRGNIAALAAREDEHKASGRPARPEGHRQFHELLVEASTGQTLEHLASGNLSELVGR